MIPELDSQQQESVSRQVCKVLWHLDIFRRSFRELSGHACMRDSCIFCALKELFAQFQYSHDTALPPDALRRALAETFFIQQRFQLGFMDDAAECFENILMRIHFHIANAESEDMCNATHCIPHQKFAMTLVEQGVCRACGATSEPLPFTQMVHYISSSALCAQAKINRDEGTDGICGDQFGQLLRKAGGMGEIRDCPSVCGAKIQIHRTLMNHPDIVSIGIVWDSERPTLDHIMDVFRTIGTTIRLQDVFHSVVDDHWAASATHQLVGIVTYYGKHYSTFFFHTKLRVWIYFDDATVREVGPRWEQVIEKCRRGHFQPLLLLYANPYGTPVSTESSPKTVSFVPGHQQENHQGTCYNSNKNSTNGNFLTSQRRAVTPNPEVHRDKPSDIRPRRAITPNPEHHHREAHLNDVNVGHYKPGQVDHVDSDVGYSSADKVPNVSNGSRDSIRMPHNGYAYYATHPQNYATNPQMMRHPVYNASEKQIQYNEDPMMKSDQPYDQKVPLRANGYFNNCDLPDSVLYQQNGVGKPISESIYISRKTVENVLNYQKVQRHRYMGGNYNGAAAGNRNSNSSLESFENALRMRGQLVGTSPYDRKPEPQEMAPPIMSNVPGCRDSGNWSGDRNSASSGSSASLENPYYILVGNKRSTSAGPPGYRYSQNKAQTENQNRTPYDAGYDSFSISSNDSFPVNQHQHAKHTQQLAQIPENVLDPLNRGLQNQDFVDECQTLCIEADKFLKKSVEKENTGDIDGAISLCNGAAAKARAAMDAPYSNPQILAYARMKHNACVMRARTLHRRMLVRQDSINSHGSSSTSTEPDSPRKSDMDASFSGTGHHSRQSSRDSTRSRSGNHSRQSSRDSGNHMRQSSRDTSNHSRQSSQDAAEKKRIELYGTLPKKSAKKKVEKTRTGSIRIKDERVMHGAVPQTPALQPVNRIIKPPHEVPLIADVTPQRDWQQQATTDYSDYGSRWEHTRRPNLHRTNSIPPNLHRTAANQPESQELINSQSFTDLSKDDSAKGNTTKLGKKQHKIRRKLMGGLIRRKNRSMPDLREGQDQASTQHVFDDCSLRKSEQHLDIPDKSCQNFYGDSVNRRLYSSHGKIPPPPPVRTTSQLTTRSQSHGNLIHPPPSPDFPPPPPEVLQAQYLDSYFPPQPDQLYPPNQMTIHADVHHERTPSDNIRPVSLVRRPSMSKGHDFPKSSVPNATNYMDSVSVLRMASPIQKSTNDDVDAEPCPAGGLLAELRLKRQQILEKASAEPKPAETKPQAATGSKWLQELQAKQHQMLTKKHDGTTSNKASDEAAICKDTPFHNPPMVSQIQPPKITKPALQYNMTEKANSQSLVATTPQTHPSSCNRIEAKDAVDYRPKSVRDLANRFEKILTPSTSPPVQTVTSRVDNVVERSDPRCANKSQEPMHENLTPVYNQKQLSNGGDCVDGSQWNGYHAIPKDNPEVPHDGQNLKYNGQLLNRVNECSHDSSLTLSNTPNMPHRTIQSNDWAYRTENGHSVSSQLLPTSHQISYGPKNENFHSANTPNGNVGRMPNGWAQNYYAASNSNFPVNGDVSLQRRSIDEHHNCGTSPPENYLPMPQNGIRQTPIMANGTPEPAKCQRPLPNYNPPPPVGPRVVQNGVPVTAIPPRLQVPYDQQALLRMQHELLLQQQQQQQRRTPTSGIEQDKSATNGSRKKKGKKSVTFSDQIALVACADDDILALPNPLLEKVLHKSSMAASSQPKTVFNPMYSPPHSSNEHGETLKANPIGQQRYPIPSPTASFNGNGYCTLPQSVVTQNGGNKSTGAKVPCYLCGKKTVVPPVTYCLDCDFYMSRFKPKK